MNMKKQKMMLIVKVGSESSPATKDQIKWVKKQLNKKHIRKALRRVATVFTHHDVTFDVLPLPS